MHKKPDSLVSERFIIRKSSHKALMNFRLELITFVWETYWMITVYCSVFVLEKPYPSSAYSYLKHEV